MRKRIICVLLCMCLLASLFSVTVNASQSAGKDTLEDLQSGVTDERFTETRSSGEDYRTWAQGDPRWGSIQMGSSGKKVSSIGCTVTSVTKLIIQCGLRNQYEFDVATLVNWLNNNNGFDSVGGLYWSKPCQLISGFTNCGELVTESTYSSSSYNSQIISWIEQGYHMTIRVGGSEHWVAVDEAKSLETGQVYIMDSKANAANADITLASRYSTFKRIHAYKGGTTPSSSPISFDSVTAQSISNSNATISAWINSEGVSSERGYYIGCSAGTMVKIAVQKYEAAWTRYNLQFEVQDSYGELSPGQQYFYNFYTVVDGMEYHSETMTFSTTGLSGISFDTLSSAVYETDAQVNVWINNPSGRKILYIGIQCGESPTDAEYRIVVENVGWTRAHLQYYISEYFEKLIPDRSYWIRYYAVADGYTYYSDYFNIITPAKIKFEEITASEITDHSATLACWMSNDEGAAITSLGMYWGEVGGTIKINEITHDVRWTRANLVYRIDDIVGDLKPSTEYSVQYYAIVNGIEYLSNAVIFTTAKSAEHSHSYERKYVVAPTCTEQGYTLYTCSCGDSFKENFVDALGHNATDWIVDLAPTCTVAGSMHTECTRCGALLQTSAIQPSGHSESDWIIDKEATCTEGGAKHKECTVCKLSLQTETIPALGHDYHEGICIRCGAEDPDWTEPEDPFVNPFIDVKENDYFYDPVLWAVQKGITNGTTPTTFSPYDPCTRGQIVTFLWRAFGSPSPKSTHNPFTDVNPNLYYYTAVLWAVDQGITTGTSATTFSPEDTCTRGQVATFLWRACGKPAPKGNGNPFSDVPQTVYYYQPILWAVENGITNGTGGGKFSPEDSCTRGQIVTFLYRAFAE